MKIRRSIRVAIAAALIATTVVALTMAGPGSGTAVILLQDQRQHSVSQEINLAGQALDGRIDWLAGGYYFHEHNDQLTAISFATPAGTAARYRTDDFFAAPSRGSGTSGTWSPYRPALDTDSWSAFDSATGKIGKARLTLGARWTDERKRYDVQFLTAPDTVPKPEALPVRVARSVPVAAASGLAGAAPV